MPASPLLLKQVRKVNQLVFHEFLGILPSGLKQTEIAIYKLDDLQYAQIRSRPNDPRRTAASVLRKAYESGGYSISDVSHILVDPGDQTMDDLAKFIRKNNIPIWTEHVS